MWAGRAADRVVVATGVRAAPGHHDLIAARRTVPAVAGSDHVVVGPVARQAPGHHDLMAELLGRTTPSHRPYRDLRVVP